MPKISIEKCLWSTFLCDAYKVDYMRYLWRMSLILTQENVMSSNIIIAIGKFIVAHLRCDAVWRLSSLEIDRIFAVSQADRAYLFLAQHNEHYANIRTPHTIYNSSNHDLHSARFVCFLHCQHYSLGCFCSIKTSFTEGERHWFPLECPRMYIVQP